MFSIKDIYMKACKKSKDLHVMTDDERLLLQSHLRKMYVDVEKVCVAHGLTMMIAYGNVIGALRHQGFIPWDDDIDLLMPREDYDKLINIYANELPSQYKIYAPNSKHGPIYRFAKIVDTSTRFVTPYFDEKNEKSGIFIDVFPLEFSPSNKFLIKFRQLWSTALMLIASTVDERNHKNFLYKKIICSTSIGKRTYMLRNFIGFIFSFKTAQSWFNMFDKFVHYKNDVSGGYVIPSEGPKITNFIPTDKSLFLPTKRMKFDDIEVFVPNQAEKYCDMEYGNWKKIPPVEQRWQHFIKEIRFTNPLK